MGRPIRPDWLLRQADDLGYRDGGPGRPRNANLRRSVSSAYYALFHALGLAMARHLLPNGTADDQYRATRSVNHGALRTVCEWITGSSRAPHHSAVAVDRLRENQDVVDIATTFLTLWDARASADYDHLASFTKIDTLNYVDLARDAVEKLAGIPQETPQDGESLLSLIALRTSVR